MARRYKRFWRGLIAGVVLALTACTPAVARGAAGSPALFIVTDLGTLGGTYSFAFGLNDTGQVVGLSSLPGATLSCGQTTCDPFLWQHGAMVDLGTLGGPYSTALAINDAGQIVGRAALPDGSEHAFLLTPVGQGQPHAVDRQAEARLERAAQTHSVPEESDLHHGRHTHQGKV